MLSAEHLTLWRGPTCLFRDLGFTLGPGEALVLRGANGSGKTTLLRVLAGLTTPEEGRVLWQGEPVQAPGDGSQRLAYCGHLTGLKPDLTVTENLAFFARLYGAGGDALAAAIRRLGLGDLAGLELRFLSAGQKRRAALARVILAGAPLWLLDEPQTHLDAPGQALLDELVRDHLDQGGTAVLASHQPGAVTGAAVRELRLGDLP